VKPAEGPIIIIKKAKGGHAAHHGGAWKVAYADFVTAMMALFMVLWLVSQTDQNMKQQLSQYFRTGVLNGAPSVMNGGTGIVEGEYVDVNTNSQISGDQASLEAAAKNVEQQVSQLTAADPDLKALAKHVDVRVTELGLLIQLLDGDGSTDTLFDSSSADLKPRLVMLLQKLAPTLGKLGNQLQVHGHTDARPFATGSNRSNWSLSFERADGARGVLERAGVRKGQISGVFAHGSTAPLVKNPVDPRNRRLAILAVRRGYESALAYGSSKTKVL
jgi:chemotaxis protein MotB